MKQKIKLNKQYGLINKQVLTNKNISANAKALYTYLSARSGNKNICNPTIPTILKDLNICEATFHKLKKELIENGIIEVIKEGKGLQKRNHYKLLHNINKNFGYVYLDTLTDPTLTLKAKAIYGLLASYSGSRFVSYPLSKIIYTYLKMSRNTYFSAIKILKKLRYVKTKQLHINGRYSYCNYYINGKKPNNTKTRYIFKNLKNKIIKSNTTKTTTTTNPNKENYVGKEEIYIEYKQYESIVKDNIEYNSLSTIYKNNNEALYWLDNILSVLTNNIYFENKGLHINEHTVTGGSLATIYNKLNFNHIQTVVESLLAVPTTKIKNIRNYLKVTLYNIFYQLEQKHFNTTRIF